MTFLAVGPAGEDPMVIRVSGRVGSGARVPAAVAPKAAAVAPLRPVPVTLSVDPPEEQSVAGVMAPSLGRGA